MKILHTIPSLAAVRGGPSKAVIEMVKALHEHNIDVQIISTNDNGLDLLEVPFGEFRDYQDVPVRFFSKFYPPVNSIKEFTFSSSFTSWLWENIASYDLVHIHAIFSYTSTIAMAIARLKKIPYIVRPLGQLCEWSLQQSALKKQLYLKIIEKSNINHSQGVHFTSIAEQKEALQLNLSSPGFVLPHGVSIPPKIPDARQRLRKHFNLPIDEPIILFLSRLHPKKGLDYLIPALSKLSDYRFIFVLAGSGTPEYENEVKSLLFAHDMEKRTYLTGFVQGELKNLLMQGADLFALTSHSENFGVAVLEALAAGIPAIATPGVALADMIEKEKLGYIAELNIDAIATSVKHILDHPQQLKATGDRARQFILENYTWDNIAAKMISVYQDLISLEK